MTRTEKVLAVIIAIQAIAMPILSTQAFKSGLRTAMELLRITV